MHFSMVTKLCFYFLFFERVRSSEHSILQYQTLVYDEIDNVLGKFLVEFEATYLQGFQFRHITIVGATINYLHQIRPLIQKHPSIICADTKRCAYREQFSRGNFVVIFLDDLTEETFEKNIGILSRCRRCRVIFICHGIIQTEDIRLIFTLAMQNNVQYAEFAHLEKNGIRFYRNFIAKNCSMEVRLFIVWRPGLRLRKINFLDFQIRDLNSCPVRVSSLTFTPKMMIKETKNGSLTIAGGREGKLLLILAAKLNFTMKLQYPAMSDQLKVSRKAAIIGDVAFGISELGIGRLRPTTDLYNKIAISFPYDEECVTWSVPRVIDWSNDIVWVEFSWEVWLSVCLLFAIACVVGYVHRSIILPKIGEQTRQGFVLIFLDVVAVHLGNPVVYVCSSAGGRFLLVGYLYYAMVISTAYKTSLASILATDQGASQIVDAQGIINANLNIGGSLYDYNILMDQVTESEITSELLQRFVVNNNDKETWNQLMSNHDYALLVRRSVLNYGIRESIKAYRSVNFDVFDDCVLAYRTVIVFQRNSQLRKPIDGIILHLTESGILDYWDSDESNTDKILKGENSEKLFENRTSSKFRYIFIYYCGCIAFCLIIFLAELIIQKQVR